MQVNKAIIQSHTAVYEGGYSNDPGDPGGRTLNGIIQVEDNAWRKKHGLPTRLLSPALENTPDWIAERDDIYDHQYWAPLRCDELLGGVDGAVYDYGVNSGIGRAARVLQRLVGVQEDGKIGPVTIAAMKKRDPVVLVQEISNERLAFLKSLPTWSRFGGGWGKRVADCLRYQTVLAKNSIAGTDITLAHTPSESEPSAKGVVPPATNQKAAATTVTIAADAGTHYWWWDLISAHPVTSAAITVASVFILVMVWRVIEARREKQQVTPMPHVKALPAIN